MNAYTKVAAAAVVVIAVGGDRALAARAAIGQTGPKPDPIPSPVASRPSAPSASQPPPPLTGTFTSNMHGISLSYPAGWTVTRGRPSRGRRRTLPRFDETSGGLRLRPGSEPTTCSLEIASQPLAGASGPAWADTIGVAEPCPTSEPIVVDGAAGRLITCDGPMRAFFWSEDRGYIVLLYRSA